MVFAAARAVQDLNNMVFAAARAVHDLNNTSLLFLNAVMQLKIQFFCNVMSCRKAVLL